MTEQVAAVTSIPTVVVNDSKPSVEVQRSGQEMSKLLTQPAENKDQVGNAHLHGAGAKKRPRHQHCVGQLTQNIHKVKKVIEKTQFAEKVDDRE